MKENNVSDISSKKRKKIIYNSSKNPAKNFFVIERLINKVVAKKGIEAIDQFIEDLRNNHDENYEKKVKEIDLGVIDSEKIIEKLIEYIDNNVRKKFVQKEKKEQQQLQAKENDTKWEETEKILDDAVLSGEQGTEIEIIEKLILDLNNNNIGNNYSDREKNYILKKLNNRLISANKKEAERQKQNETDIRKAEKAMKQIQDIVEREYQAGNIKNKASYLSAIRDLITGENAELDLNIKIGKTSQKYLIQMINENIKTEKEEWYFEEVRKFTKDFQFLWEDPLTVKGIHGANKMYKITDSENYWNFYDLRNAVQKGYNEEEGIEHQLKKIESRLNRDEIDDKKRSVLLVNRRILFARQEVMKKELERKAKTGEIR